MSDHPIKPQKNLAKKRITTKHLSIFPNACTSLNLFCGYLSIIMTSEAEFLAAGWLILVANIFDILDGRLARLTSVTSKFGAELDSLADLVSFGVAPAFLIYNRYFDKNLKLGIVVSSVFVVCGALRLARFNVTPPSRKDVFEGLPIPAGASLLCTMVIFELQFFNFLRIPPSIIPYVVLITSYLMVSKIEYPALKKTPGTGKKRLVVTFILLMALLINPPITLFFLSWGFAFYGLLFAILKFLIRFTRFDKRDKTATDLSVF